jgi:enamine deaminase RidA (YjgF/YER057c/UK114 family)
MPRSKEEEKTMTTSSSKAPQGIWADGGPKPLMPYTPAVKAGGWLFISGQLASDFKTGIAPEAEPPNPNVESRLKWQSHYLLKNIRAVVEAAGMDMSKDAVRIWQWFTSPYPTNEEFAQGNTWPRISITDYLDARNDYIHEPRPASTGMGMKELPVRGALVEVDMILIEGGKSQGYPTPSDVPSPLAGYSPAIRRGDWIFLAGEIPVDWKGDYGVAERHGEPSALAREARINPYVWYGSEVEKQTDYVLWKLSRIAEEAGTSLDRAVKADVYIGDPKDYDGMERVWKKWFPKNPPARCVIPYMGLGGKGSRVEVALTLLANDAKITAEPVETSKAPRPFSHEPQAMRAGNFLFLSQQMGANEHGVLPEGLTRHPAFPYYGQPAREQMRHILGHVAAICEAGGTRLENVVRRACFHDDGRWFAESIAEWAAHFPGLKPASTTMMLNGPLVVPGAHQLLDLTAYIPD